MLPFLLLGGGVLLVYALTSKSSSPTAPAAPGGYSGPSTADTLLAGQATATAQAFNAQAQQLGLTQAQAQEAYSLGLMPQDYVNSGMAQGAANPYIAAGGGQ